MRPCRAQQPSARSQPFDRQSLTLNPSKKFRLTLSHEGTAHCDLSKLRARHTKRHMNEGTAKKGPQFENGSRALSWRRSIRHLLCDRKKRSQEQICTLLVARPERLAEGCASCGLFARRPHSHPPASHRQTSGALERTPFFVRFSFGWHPPDESAFVCPSDRQSSGQTSGRTKGLSSGQTLGPEIQLGTIQTVLLLVAIISLIWMMTKTAKLRTPVRLPHHLPLTTFPITTISLTTFSLPA